LCDAGPFALALKFNPDVNKKAGAEKKFKEIANAYEVLSDDEKTLGPGIRRAKHQAGDIVTQETRVDESIDILEQLLPGSRGRRCTTAAVKPTRRATWEVGPRTLDVAHCTLHFALCTAKTLRALAWSEQAAD